VDESDGESAESEAGSVGEESSISTLKPKSLSRLFGFPEVVSSPENNEVANLFVSGLAKDEQADLGPGLFRSVIVKAQENKITGFSGEQLGKMYDSLAVACGIPAGEDDEGIPVAALKDQLAKTGIDLKVKGDLVTFSYSENSVTAESERPVISGYKFVSITTSHKSVGTKQKIGLESFKEAFGRFCFAVFHPERAQLQTPILWPMSHWGGFCDDRQGTDWLFPQIIIM